MLQNLDVSCPFFSIQQCTIEDVYYRANNAATMLDNLHLDNSEAAKTSKLNPLAAEFVPSKANNRTEPKATST